MAKKFKVEDPDLKHATGIPTKWGVRVGWLVGFAIIGVMVVLTILGKLH